MASFTNPHKVSVDQIYNQGTNFATQITNAFNQAEENRVRSSLINMQARYDEKQNDLMLQLQQTNDPDEMEKLVNDFQQQTLNSLKDKNNQTFYCHSSFEEKKAREMIDGQNVALQGKVAMLRLQKTNEQTMLKDNDTIALNRKNKVGQDGIEADLSIYKTWYNTGKIDDTKYAALKLDAASYYASKDYENIANNAIDQAIKQGKTFSYVQDLIDKDTNEYSYTDASGIRTTLNKDAVKQQTLKTAQQLYSIKLNEYQSQNDTYMSNMYTQLRSSSPEAQQQIVSKAMNTLGRWKTNELDSQRHTYWTDKFASYSDMLGKYGSATANKNSPTESYDDYLKKTTEEFIEAVKDGSLSDLQAASECFYRTIQNDFFNKVWKGMENLSDEEKIDKWNKEYSKSATAKILNSKVISDFLKNDPRYASINSQYENIKTDIRKHPEKYIDGSESYIAGLVLDIITSSSKNVTPEAMAEQLQKQINLITISTSRKLYKNTEHIAGNDKDLLRSIEATNNNDVVFTDIYGNEQWIAGTKEKVENIANQQREVMARSFGVNPEDMQITYMKTEKDMQPIPVFNFGSYQLHFENKNGKAIIIDQYGDEYDYKSAKDLKKEDKAINKQARKEIKEAQKKEKEITKKQQNEAIKVSYDKLPISLKENMTKEQWEEKRMTVEGYNLLVKNGYFK